MRASQGQLPHTCECRDEGMCAAKIFSPRAGTVARFTERQIAVALGVCMVTSPTKSVSRLSLRSSPSGSRLARLLAEYLAARSLVICLWRAMHTGIHGYGTRRPL